MLRQPALACALLVVCGALAPAGAQQAPYHGSSAAVSPDGKRIAYMGDRSEGTHVFVSDATGANEMQLTQGPIKYGKPSWSADGSRVRIPVFEKDTSYLFEIAPGGGAMLRVAKVPGRNPVLLPDPRRVLFSTADWLTMQLMVSFRDGSDAKRISDGVGAIYNHALSPDGKQIAYTRNVKDMPLSVWIMNVDGSGARQVTRFSAADGNPQVPAWSPDGRRLAVQSAVPTAADPKKHAGHVWIVDVATGKATKLAAHDAPYLDESPSWFPDGKRIAFQSDRTGRMEIWVMNADGTGARQVTK